MIPGVPRDTFQLSLRSKIFIGLSTCVLFFFFLSFTVLSIGIPLDKN